MHFLIVGYRVSSREKLSSSIPKDFGILRDGTLRNPAGQKVAASETCFKCHSKINEVLAWMCSGQWDKMTQEALFPTALLQLSFNFHKPFIPRQCPTFPGILFFPSFFFFLTVIHVHFRAASLPTESSTPKAEGRWPSPGPPSNKATQRNK